MPENRFTYNAQSEKQKDLNGGKGYFYETDFRGYDPQLGRFVQYEPLADLYSGISPYQFAFNNPVRFNDPLGLEGTPSTIGTKDIHQATDDEIGDAPTPQRVEITKGPGGGGKTEGGDSDTHVEAPYEGETFSGYVGINGVDDSGMRIGVGYSKGYTYFRSTPVGSQSLGRFNNGGDLSNTNLILKYDPKIVQPYTGKTNYKIKSGYTEIQLKKSFSLDDLTEIDIKNMSLIITISVIYRNPDGIDQAKSATDIGHEIFVHAEDASEFFEQLKKDIDSGKITSKEQVVEAITKFFIKDDSGKTKEQRDHSDMKRRLKPRYNRFQKELLKILQGDRKKAAEREFEDDNE
ncbi:MAG: RHS repeat-associated core domain-containing protein [Microscillaceae bacterium]|nr:RHS repeat-associated core domain-containing protein [Microscillaceae bacterium]